jgi:hypothetical protein
MFVEAAQWHRNGDHPQDNCGTFIGSDGIPFQGEGHVVRYFRHPYHPSESLCPRCDIRMHEHGWIDTPAGGHIVCPGDYVVTDAGGAIYPLRPEVFAATYQWPQSAAEGGKQGGEGG